MLINVSCYPPWQQCSQKALEARRSEGPCWLPSPRAQTGHPCLLWGCVKSEESFGCQASCSVPWPGQKLLGHSGSQVAPAPGPSSGSASVAAHLAATLLPSKRRRGSAETVLAHVELPFPFFISLETLLTFPRSPSPQASLKVFCGQSHKASPCLGDSHPTKTGPHAGRG